MPTGPATGGASVGWLTIDSTSFAEAADDQPERIDRPLRADLDRLDEACTVIDCPRTIAVEAVADPEGALGWRSISSAVRSVAVTSLRRAVRRA